MSELHMDGGPRSPILTVDEEGYRTYTVTILIKGNPLIDGPYAALLVAAQRWPIGSPWNFDIDTLDQWATRRPETVVSIHDERKGDPAQYYAVEMVFSNRPSNVGRCDGDVGNPMCLPDKVSGRFVKYVEEAVTAEAIDYFTDGVLVRSISGGNVPIRNSAHEQLKGPQVERDRNRQRVVIQQNVLNLELDLLDELIDTVNDASLWGFANTTVKLSDVSWERHYYGSATNPGSTGTGTGTEDCPDFAGCQSYFTRTLEFDIDGRGFDKLLLDEGTKLLNGHWSDKITNEWVLDNLDGLPPDPLNPAHFCLARDRDDNLGVFVLSGEGLPAGALVNAVVQGVGTIEVQHYPRKNFLLLGIPTSIE